MSEDGKSEERKEQKTEENKQSIEIWLEVSD